jgi:hypothetical protein
MARVSPAMALDFSQLISTAPCGYVAGFPEGWGIVPDLHHAGGCAGTQLDARVDGVGYGHAIDIEGIDIDARLEWAEGDAPDAAFVLLNLGVSMAPSQSPVSVTSEALGAKMRKVT